MIICDDVVVDAFTLNLVTDVWLKINPCCLGNSKFGIKKYSLPLKSVYMYLVS